MKKTADFLFEIGCEEIPAGMIAKACEEFKVILEKYLSTAGLLVEESVEVWGAPRRIVGMCKALRLKQEDSEHEVTGPPKSVAYDNVGQPTRAAVSFADKQGVPVSKLFVVNTPRGEYLAAKLVTRGRPTEAILPEILPHAVAEISWPRSMCWTTRDGMRFIRPIRWLVALLDGKPLKLELAGVRAGRESVGHRFLGKSRIPIKGVDRYEASLRKNFVLVRPEARQKKIQSELAKLAAGRGLRIHDDPLLANLVVYLNEYPTAIMGEFDPSYLELPDEILITVMRDHQKYFALHTRDGRMAPSFLAVINLDRDLKGLIRAGHERVLRARFADAKFFWQSDQKCRLADFLPKLSQVTYESRLGSYGDKVERMRQIARWFAEQWFAAAIPQASSASADRAAELAKCDLVTEMVKEFPELQGIVGGLYAEAQGEPEDVFRAVYDHYRPAGLDDKVPRNLTGCAVALADKLDALVGCIASGLLPTGSSDPFGLRRAALGVVKIILERKLPVSLSAAVSAGAKALSTNNPKIHVKPATEKQILDFILERARFVMRERLGFAYDEVNAALAAGSDDLVDAVRRMEALKAIRRTKNFEPLAVSFKRIRKIIEKAGPPENWRLPAVRVELFTEDAERKLHSAASAVAQKATSEKRAGKYREALQAIAELRPAVDRFFTDVLVMAEDEQVRRNRLTLLAELLKEFSTIADFSEIAAEEKS
ncbi:MAG TPA: glycine--tRNA ligase subunit beta [Candidatus Acidoferrales bacterium]|nr:glycine--tRNA ligase subunit beta [Candidatus Acidoferrales bacterium]